MTCQGTCPHCGCNFQPQNKTKIYCSKRCGKNASKARAHKRKNPNAKTRQARLPMVDGKKKCGKCSQFKELSQFSRKAPQGYAAACHSCKRTYNSKRIEYVREFNAKAEAKKTGQDWREIYKRMESRPPKKPAHLRITQHEIIMSKNMATPGGIRLEVAGAIRYLKAKLLKERGLMWCRMCSREHSAQEMEAPFRLGFTGRCKSCARKRARKYHKSEKFVQYRRGHRRRRRTNPINKVIDQNRNRIRTAILRQTGSTARVPKGKIKYLGCSAVEAVAYLERMFVRHMSWENYGTVWHIDHVIPCTAFDLTNEDEISKCFHYTNLQPMWAKQNMRKGARKWKDHQPLLLV